MKNPEQIIDRLCGIFAPIHAKWRDSKSEALHLWQHTHHLSAEEVVCEDLKHIGLFFAHADALGAQSELTLTAECLALVHSWQTKLPRAKLLESAIEVQMNELKHHIDLTIKDPLHPDSEFEPPQCWRIAQHMATAGKCSPTALEGLHETLSDLAYLFLLRDGNITPDEDERLKRYHAALGR